MTALQISIITINYNNLAGLQATMPSVINQVFTGFEYIVIDGGSTDGSKEYIEQQGSTLAYWVSEKDKGIYHAMNKGIIKAKGDYLLFLNSGDFFYSVDSLSKLFKNNKEDIIYGNLLVNEDNGFQRIYKYPATLSFGFFYQSSLPHQATLIKRSLFESIGLYNENLQIAADYEFFLKAICLNSCSHHHVNETITVFSLGGISTNPAFDAVRLNEKKIILEGSFSAFLQEYKEYFVIKAELNNYRNSRAHKKIQQLIHSSLIKKIRKQ